MEQESRSPQRDNVLGPVRNTTGMFLLDIKIYQKISGMSLIWRFFLSLIGILVPDITRDNGYLLLETGICLTALAHLEPVQCLFSGVQAVVCAQASAETPWKLRGGTSGLLYSK